MSIQQSQGESHRIFVSDCEGPISKNDNAFELAGKFIPQGQQLFTLLSRYDDILADIVKRENYKAGDTLKLILPFLRASGLTNEEMVRHSQQSIILIPGVKETFEFIRSSMPAHVVSTSYEQYMRALCQVLNFPFENVYCTRLNLDMHTLTENEKYKLEELRKEIVTMPTPRIPKQAKSPSDLPRKTQEIVQRLDEIFWQEISSMKIGTVLREVNPVGGPEKTSAVREIAVKLHADIRDLVYVGDSITDVEVFRFVRRNGGLTVSFNGNTYAVREAEVAVLSNNAIVTAVLADTFNRFGKAQVISLVKNWNSSTVNNLNLNEPLKRCFLKICRKESPRVELVTSGNREKLMIESTAFRKRVRGEAIGKLG